MRLGRPLLLILLSLLALHLPASTSQIESENFEQFRFNGLTQTQRDQVANLGLSLERIDDDVYTALGDSQLKSQLIQAGIPFTHSPLKLLDFPDQDAPFHNLSELQQELQLLAEQNDDIVQLDEVGRSFEGRPIWHLRMSTDLDQSSAKPGILFLGGHHAREHLSVEVPLALAQNLVRRYRAGQEPELSLLRSREIHILPLVNPDGKDFDISSHQYRYWRKSRAQNANGSRGVDLNRNYAFGFGGEGSSGSPNSEVYRGPEAFSEPETKAVKELIERQQNISILLSFHTYSELILYPWGHTHSPIQNQADFLVHKTMAERMAQWNGYTPQQSSQLYVASGDTTDWSYGTHGIISFTFELDPASIVEGGFYPGAEYIQRVIDKNLPPSLFLIEYADNPYRVLKSELTNF